MHSSLFPSIHPKKTGNSLYVLTLEQYIDTILSQVSEDSGGFPGRKSAMGVWNLVLCHMAGIAAGLFLGVVGLRVHFWLLARAEEEAWRERMGWPPRRKR